MYELRVAFVACALSFSQMFSAVASAQATDVVCSQCVGTGDIATEAVNSAKIADGSIKDVDLSPNSVSTTNMRNNTVSFNKLSTGVRSQLDEAIAVVTFEHPFAEAEGVVGAECPEDKWAVSASCACDNNEGANNDGVLSFCASFDTFAVAACTYDANTIDLNLPAPIAQVEAVCMGAISADGTPWVPTPAGLAPFDAVSAKAAQSVEQTVKWRKEQHEIYEAAVAKHRHKFADYQRRMPSK